jgi:hypothetical protein
MGRTDKLLRKLRKIEEELKHGRRSAGSERSRPSRSRSASRIRRHSSRRRELPETRVRPSKDRDRYSRDRPTRDRYSPQTLVRPNRDRCRSSQPRPSRSRNSSSRSGAGSHRSNTPASATSQLSAQQEERLVINNDVTLEEDPLHFLGELSPKNKEAFELHPSLCKRWGPSLRQGLEEKMRTTLLEKYPHPTNFGECKAPILDLEIKRALDQLTLRRDKYQAYTQDKVGNTIAALGKSINKLLQSELPKPLKDDILTDLNNAVLIQTEVFFEMSKSRRFLILPMLSPTVKEVVQDSAPTESLFGGDLTERLRAAKALEKSSHELKHKSKMIMPSHRATNKSLNGRGQPSQMRDARPQRSPTCSFNAARRSFPKQRAYKRHYQQPPQQQRNRK